MMANQHRQHHRPLLCPTCDGHWAANDSVHWWQCCAHLRTSMNASKVKLPVETAQGTRALFSTVGWINRPLCSSASCSFQLGCLTSILTIALQASLLFALLISCSTVVSGTVVAVQATVAAVVPERISPQLSRQHYNHHQEPLPTLWTSPVSGDEAYSTAPTAAVAAAVSSSFPKAKRRVSPVEIVHKEAPNFSNHPMYMNSYLTYSECDRIFISKSLNASYGTVNGTFEGPTLPQYPPLPPTSAPTVLDPNATTTEGPPSTPREPHARQCIFTFIAAESERVRLSFTKFALRSEAPECLDEYMDLYSDMLDPNTDLLTTPFGGRFCDQIIPHDRISLYQTIVIAFYTEKEYSIGKDIFQGRYQFINATPYISGTPVPNSVCSFAIYSEQRREGEFMSPTYPGVYPKDINCRYLFKGISGQRVKLEFMDFDLYYGGSHCPLDYMKIYDGDSEKAPLIHTYCGQQRQLFVFSSGTSLFVHFSTMPRVAESMNRGFSAYYEFSEKFVNLGFIDKNDTSTEHILGTECDQRILSKKESNGTIYSPNYPFLYHPNIQCKYFLYGLQDAQNLERINFQFEMLQIPTKDINECTDAYVRLYTQTQAMDEFDYVFCGETLPQPVVSEGPILMIVFNSGSSQGPGFRAHYWFETDYKIPGIQGSPGQCDFSYTSASGGDKTGEFNSPRHPSNYPSNTLCKYEFFGEPDEQVMLVLSHFKFSDAEVEASGVGGYNEVCNRDWMEIYAIEPMGRELFYGRFCGYTAPGPIITKKGSSVKVIANTDETDVSSGFLAAYAFIKPTDMIHQNKKPILCGGNVTGSENGIITSPNYPNYHYNATRFVCDWFISVKAGHKVMLHFDVFSVEGEPVTRGCSGAVVRVWTNPSISKPVELCGEKLANGSKEFVSEDNVLRLTFITAMKAVGASGFSAIWTEVAMPVSISDLDGSSPLAPLPTTFSTVASTLSTEKQSKNSNTSKGKTCRTSGSFGSASTFLELTPSSVPESSKQANQKQTPVQKYPFLCKKTEYCISPNLLCNGIPNCGFGDFSDEDGCTKEAQLSLFDLLGGIAGLTLFASFTIGILCLTAIMVGNWVRRAENNEKESTGTNGNTGGMHKVPPPGGPAGASTAVPHGNAYVHMSPHHYHLHHPAVASIHPSASRTGSPRHALADHHRSGASSSRHGSPYRSSGVISGGYPSELTGGSTPTHRIIEVMNVGSHSSSQAKSKWSTLPSTSSEGPAGFILDDEPVSFHSAGHPHAFLHDSDLGGLDSPSNASIPPPPPPPAIGAATNAYINSGRPTTSSLANFYAERPTELVGGPAYRVALHEHGNAGNPVNISGSVTSIDRYGYRTIGRIVQQPQQPHPLLATTSTMTRQSTIPTTFGYGPAQSSFHTLPHHHHLASHSLNLHHQGSSLNYELAPMRGISNATKQSPSGEIMMDQLAQQQQPNSTDHNGGAQEDDESSLSLRMAAPTHLHACGNGSHEGGNGRGNGDLMNLCELDDEPNSEAMMMGLNHQEFTSNTKRFTRPAYLLSEQSDSLLVDE